MKECIEREAAIFDLETYEKQAIKDEYALAIAGCRSHIRNIPAADVVEVRHGRWLSKDMYGDAGLCDMWIARLAEQSDYYAYCSVCGKDAEYNAEGSLILSEYCPNCGARMDGGVNDGKA